MYQFSPYHIGLAVLGVGVILAHWLPRFVSGREPASSTLLILAGFGAGLVLPASANAIDPLKAPLVWERVSEVALIVGLFGSGLRIDRLVTLARWSPTIRLLAIGMPACIAAVALLGWTAGGMTLAGALLLGSVLAPTDPVLASDVQVGPPMEGGEHQVRFTLTAEAGLNDGLAFPFVHLALAVGAAGMITAGVVQHWLLVDVLYRIAVGVLGGVVTGWLLGKILFGYPQANPLAETKSGLVAVAGVLLCFGLTELVEGYGFIATFIAGITLRRSEVRHKFHRTLHSFTDTIEHALTAALLLALGFVLPLLWPALTLPYVAIGLALIFVVRPVIGWLCLKGTAIRERERLVVAFYGVRGIGSIYYVAYASGHLKLPDAPALWAAVAFTILVSTLVHGLSAGLAVERVTGEVIGGAEEPPDAEAEDDARASH